MIMMISLSGLTQRKSETIYYTWIKKLDRTSTYKGYLMDLREDEVLYLAKPKYSSLHSENLSNSISFLVNGIESLEFRRSNQVGNGLYKGALWGGVIVGVISVALNNGFFDETKVFLVGFGIGSIPGALIGGSIGAKRIKFYLNGEKRSYQKQKEKLEQFLMI